MRHDRITAARIQPSVFICECCDAHEHTLSQHAPQGWAVEYFDGQGYAFCPDCQGDLQSAHFSPSATAMRLGPASHLDEAEFHAWDEEDRRYVHRVAAFAEAERLGRIVMPILLGAIAIGLTLCALSQGARWITV